MSEFDAFLKLDGINGESVQKGFEQQIEISSWSWGLSNTGTGHVGTGSGSGKASFQDLSISKRMDLSSTMLIKAVTLGDHIKSGIITVRKSGGTQLSYVQYEMTEILVSSYSLSSGGDTVYDNFTLNFRTFKITYTPQSETGGAAAGSPFGYNIAKGETIG